MKIIIALFFIALSGCSGYQRSAIDFCLMCLELTEESYYEKTPICRDADGNLTSCKQLKTTDIQDATTQ